MEKPFYPKIAKAIHAQILQATTILRDKGYHAAKIANEKILLNERLIKPLKEIYAVFGMYMARRTTREINASAKIEQKAGFGNDEELLAEIIAYLNQFILNRAVIPITQTTRDIILEKLIEGEEQGLGAEEIARELESAELTIERARLIVRTEALKAMQYGQRVSSSKSRWMTESEWIAAHDARTRDSHRLVDGETVPEGGRFKVAIFQKGIQIGFDLMAGPGDPHASAANVCNCRCTLVTVAARDKNGRLIQKSNNSVLLPV